MKPDSCLPGAEAIAAGYLNDLFIQKVGSPQSS
ncbi:MAG: hypothetical protein JWO91_1671 [Acidobacteriaceae bacterium]|jgi:hypothetical protein|nr:hypothetical protein [Acidobacteriaceae bacterium]